MTTSESLIANIACKTTFYDRHDERAYRRAIELARRLIEEPALIQRGLRFLETHTKPDPHQADAYNSWLTLLAEPPESIARALLDDTPRGEELRNTAPVFFTLTPDAAKSLWAVMS